jgi:hypothetical protein
MRPKGFPSVSSQYAIQPTPGTGMRGRVTFPPTADESYSIGPSHLPNVHPNAFVWKAIARRVSSAWVSKTNPRHRSRRYPLVPNSARTTGA